MRNGKEGGKKETQQNKKFEKLNSGASDILKGEICS